MCVRSAIAGSISSSSRSRRTISTAWRASPRQAACRSAPTKACIRATTSRAITTRKAARGGSLKAIKLGGLRALFEAGRLCDRLGMKVNISCKTGESSIASAAATHVAAAVPALDWGLTVTNPGLAEDVAVEPLAVERGHVEVPERPGLGIEVDERRVRRWQQEFSARKVA